MFSKHFRREFNPSAAPSGILSYLIPLGECSLAPDVQEAILFLPRVEAGKDPVTERELRTIVAEVEWGRQRGRWGSSGKS